MNNLADVIGLSIASVSVNISMYLMMDHNQSEYVLFLKVMSKLHCNCCGCGRIINEQILELDLDANVHISVLDKSATKTMDRSVDDTQDHSLPPPPKTKPTQQSLFTKTHKQSTREIPPNYD